MFHKTYDNLYAHNSYANIYNKLQKDGDELRVDRSIAYLSTCVKSKCKHLLGIRMIIERHMPHLCGSLLL